MPASLTRGRGRAEEADRAEKVSLEQKGAARPRPDSGARNKTLNTAAAPGEAPGAAPGTPRPPPPPRAVPASRSVPMFCGLADSSATACTKCVRALRYCSNTAGGSAGAAGERLSARPTPAPPPRPRPTLQDPPLAHGGDRAPAPCTRRRGNRAGGSGAGGGA